MKQFNDVVTLVRNGKEVPALVAASREVDGEERLQLAYLDPEIGAQQLAQHGTVSRMYAVPPWKEGVVNGWKEFAALGCASGTGQAESRCGREVDAAEKLMPLRPAVHDADRISMRSNTAHLVSSDGNALEGQVSYPVESAGQSAASEAPTAEEEAQNKCEKCGEPSAQSPCADCLREEERADNEGRQEQPV